MEINTHLHSFQCGFISSFTSSKTPTYSHFGFSHIKVSSCILRVRKIAAIFSNNLSTCHRIFCFQKWNFNISYVGTLSASSQMQPFRSLSLDLNTLPGLSLQTSSHSFLWVHTSHWLCSSLS